MRRLLEVEHTVVLEDGAAGIGGLGKTQVAAEFAYRHSNQYQYVWWMHAKRPSILACEFSSLAEPLALHERASGDQNRLIEAVRAWLAGNENWLLVVDNINDAQAVRRLIPPGPRGHVIVISRSSGWEGTEAVVPVGALEAQEAIGLLLKRSGRTEAGSAELLSAALGGIPQVLDLAGACLAVTGMSFAEFSGLIRPKGRGPVQATAESVSEALKRILGLLIENLAEQSPESVGLLALFSFLDGEEIPYKLITDGRSVLPPQLAGSVGDPKAFVRIVEALSERGIVNLADEGASVHPVIQAAMHELLTAEQWRLWARAALRVVMRAFPTEDEFTEPVPAYSRLLPHVFSVAHHVERLGIEQEESGRLLNMAGLYLRACEELSEAQVCYQHAVKLGEQTYGLEHPSVAIRVNNLGVVLLEQGNFARAKECFLRAFTIFEGTYGPSDASLAMPVRNICNVLGELGDGEEQRRWQKRAMSLYLDLYGWNHPEVAACANEMGLLLHRQKRLERACECFEHAVKAEESSEQSSKQRLASYVGNWGNAHMQMGNTGQALECFERALELNRSVFGETHELVATSLANLGTALRKVGQLPRAQKSLEEALRIFGIVKYDKSEEVNRVVVSLAKVTRDQGDLAAARSLLQRALAYDESTHGKDSSKVAQDLANLGRVLLEMDAFGEAESCFKRAVSIAEGIHGPQHEIVAELLSELGNTYRASGRLHDALEQYQRALGIDTVSNGKGDISVARDTSHIASILLHMGDSVGALGNLMRALEIYESSLGASHTKTVKIRDRIDALHANGG